MSVKNAHLLQPVEHYGVPINSARAVVVLVHGRGQSPEYMNEHVVARLGTGDVAFVAPAAASNSWYPNSFLAPLSDNQPGLDFTMQCLGAIGEELIHEGMPSQRIVWCGFSQGACAVSQFLTIAPRRWGGLIAFTGGLIGPPGSKWNFDGSFAGMPAYFSTSEADPFVPESRVRESAAQFAEAGANVTVEFHLGRTHEISDAEINRALFVLSKISATT